MITRKLKKNDLYYILKGITTFAITVTMLVYQLVLSSGVGAEAYIGHELECNFVHLFTPLLIIFDYIIFSAKGHINKKYPLVNLINANLLMVYYKKRGNLEKAKYYAEFIINNTTTLKQYINDANEVLNTDE